MFQSNLQSYFQSMPPVPDGDLSLRKRISEIDKILGKGREIYEQFSQDADFYQDQMRSMVLARFAKAGVSDLTGFRANNLSQLKNQLRARKLLPIKDIDAIIDECAGVATRLDVDININRILIDARWQEYLDEATSLSYVVPMADVNPELSDVFILAHLSDQVVGMVGDLEKAHKYRSFNVDPKCFNKNSLKCFDISKVVSGVALNPFYGEVPFRNLKPEEKIKIIEERVKEYIECSKPLDFSSADLE